ncbi:MAG: OmpA family protein [Bacteroidota bacterium]|nr:OmpA family protein [Bacteroidota bacterium]
MKKQLIIIYCFLAVGMLHAQESGHYLHFNAGGGLNNLSYQLQNGTQQGRLGYTVNAAYSFFFMPQLGIQSGIGLQTYSAASSINYLTTSSETDVNGDPFVLSTLYKNWKEKQQTLFLDIPLTIQYRRYLNDKIGLLASAGAKIAIPLSASYKSESGKITTTGYYKQWNITLDDLPQYGFTTPINRFEGDYTFKNTYSAIADLGGLYKLSNKTDLYVGGYVNYGLNNILKADSKVVYQMNGTYNGILASNQTDKVIPISFGLKIGIYLNIGKTNGIRYRHEQLKPAVLAQTTDTTKENTVTETITPEQPVLASINNDSIKTAEAFEKTKTIAGTVNLKFNYNSAKSLSTEQDKLLALSVLLKENPTIALDLIGHTCNIGSREANRKVGLKRAETVKQLFIEHGTPASQLRTESKAFDEPLVPNTSNENRQKNRRVEIKPELLQANSQAIGKARELAKEIAFMFHFNRVKPINSENEQVKALSNIMIANPDITLKLTGHTCNIGSRTINLKIGLNRALAVKQLFIKNGVPAIQIITESNAFDVPLVPNTSVHNRMKNRRVELEIVK